VPAGDNPLDASGVHPEAYPVVEKILATPSEPADIMGNAPTLLKASKPAEYTDERFGLPTVQDILGTGKAGPRSAPGVQDGSSGRRRET
jgi:uncharacterized protein